MQLIRWETSFPRPAWHFRCNSFQHSTVPLRYSPMLTRLQTSVCFLMKTNLAWIFRNALLANGGQLEMSDGVQQSLHHRTVVLDEPVGPQPLQINRIKCDMLLRIFVKNSRLLNRNPKWTQRHPQGGLGTPFFIKKSYGLVWNRY